MYSLRYWYFDHGLKFPKYACNGCHELVMLCLNVSNITIITVKSIDYCCIFYDITKSDGIYLWENSVLEDRGYIQNAFQ